MSLNKVILKFFLKATSEAHARSFMETFNHWIQTEAFGKEILIDCADYTHMHKGTGVILVGHRVDFSWNEEEPRAGFVVSVKRATELSFEQAFDLCFDLAVRALALIAKDPLHQGLELELDSPALILNDRLNAPNTAETYAQYESEVLILAKKRGGEKSCIIGTEQNPQKRACFYLKLEAPLA